jgi:hypothetical protein
MLWVLSNLRKLGCAGFCMLDTELGPPPPPPCSDCDGEFEFCLSPVGSTGDESTSMFATLFPGSDDVLDDGSVMSVVLKAAEKTILRWVWRADVPLTCRVLLQC